METTINVSNYMDDDTNPNWSNFESKNQWCIMRFLLPSCVWYVFHQALCSINVIGLCGMWFVTKLCIVWRINELCVTWLSHHVVCCGSESDRVSLYDLNSKLDQHVYKYIVWVTWEISRVFTKHQGCHFTSLDMSHQEWH